MLTISIQIRCCHWQEYIRRITRKRIFTSIIFIRSFLPLTPPQYSLNYSFHWSLHFTNWKTLNISPWLRSLNTQQSYVNYIPKWTIVVFSSHLSSIILQSSSLPTIHDIGIYNEAAITNSQWLTDCSTFRHAFRSTISLARTSLTSFSDPYPQIPSLCYVQMWDMTMAHDPLLHINPSISFVPSTQYIPSIATYHPELFLF